MIRVRSEFSKLDMNKAIKITLTIYFASSLFLLLFVFELLVPTMEAKLIGLFITMVTVFAVYLLYRALRNPFRYPYFEQAFDVSNKRNVNIEDWIDRFLANERNWELICSHSQRIEDWKREQEIFLQTCFLKKRRTNQYKRTLDDSNAFCFVTQRVRTKYRQQNYVKIPYKVKIDDEVKSVSFEWLVMRYARLENIGFETTLSAYRSQNQRKLMTKKLRKEIAQRDNYTCQICGKYMPDGGGLHIDHIVPVSKGGKTVPRNLQVLCSKCNGRKGAKYVY